MSAAHTPGPWSRDQWGEVRDPSGALVHFRSVSILASGSPENIARAEANTALTIVAPQLLEALQDALDFIEDYEDVVDGSYGVPQPNRAMQLARELRAAIAKAEGKA